MSENFYSSTKENDQIELGKIFRFLLMQSKLIIAITLSIFILSYINYLNSPKKYKIKSLLQYESFNQSVFDPSNSLQRASGNSSSDISNLVTLYESRTNMLQVISDLKLNIDIMDLYDDEFIDIEISSDESDIYLRKNLKFSFSQDGYSLLDKNLKKIKAAKYGKEIYFENLSIIIKSSNLKIDRPIDINYRNPEGMYNSIKSSIVIEANTSRNSFFRNEGLITVSYVTDDIGLGKEIINYANNIFLEQRIFVETEKSRKAIDFIDQNIRSLEETVESNKIKLKEFREKNQSIDVSLEIEAIIEKIQSLDRSI